MSNERNDRRPTGTLPSMEKPEKIREKDFSQDEGYAHHFTLEQRTLIDGKYVIIAPISYGGQAELYEVSAQDGKHYAAKIYYQGFSSKYHDDIVHLLITHKQPGLVRLLDYGMFGDRHYYIYPLYRTGSLDVTKPKMDERRLKKFISVLNEAIHAMHEAGLIHADIKPANMIYDEGNDLPVLYDFGSVTKGEQDSKSIRSLTDAAERVSEGYTAPYSLLFRAVSGCDLIDLSVKSDYFALGIALCEIYMEQPDFKMFHSNVDIVLQQHDGIVFPPEIRENQRFYNLVQALIADSVQTQPGYQEVKAWLNGKTLERTRII